MKNEKQKLKRLFILFLTTLFLLTLTACGNQKPATMDIFAMDTYMSLVAYGKEAQAALDDSTRAINLLEAEISRTREGSDVDTLNKTGTWHGSADGTDATADILRQALQYSAETGGLFDVTIAPLVLLWNITGNTPYVPAREEIEALLPLVGSDHLHLGSGNTAALDAGCAVDLGGIGKGYASDLVRLMMEAHGIESGTVSLGGNVYVRGSKPDGKPWNVGIQDPAGGDCAAYVSLTDAFVVTSGGYQRYYTAPDGTVYQHILDPRTGAPAQSDLASVSIITTDSGTRADAYSTALYIMGEQGAIDFWRSHGDFDMILITADGRVLYTPGLTVTIPEGSTYDFQALA